jgi:hypothetical protein
MTSRDFAYWMQSLFEVAEMTTFNKKQTEIIKRHLAMVFVHEIDPSMGNEEHQGKLNSIHNPDVVVSNSSTSPTTVQEALELLDTQLSPKPPILPSRPDFLNMQFTTANGQILTARC